jgi:hypothetical protein
MPEILDDGFSRICDGGDASGHMQVSTSGFTMNGPDGDEKESQNRQPKTDISQHPTPPQHPNQPKRL